MPDEPLSYWVSLARIGFEEDFNRLFDELDISQAQLAKRVTPPVSEAYVSKLLNGTAGNYELSTMAKWARAVGGIVQVRVIKEDGEVVRVVDYQTARDLDGRCSFASSGAQLTREKVVHLNVWKGRYESVTVEAISGTEANHG